MKNTLLKKVLITLPLLISVMYVSVTSAHDQPGNLGTTAGATDMYQINCFDDLEGNGASEHLILEIIDNPPVAAPKVSVQIYKGGRALNTTDAVDGDNVYSPEIKFNGGDGAYIVTVDKSSAGDEDYKIVYHCENSTGGHTGTNISPFQEQ